MSLPQQLLALVRLVRYRFLVVAGLLPYIVGSLAALRCAEPWEPSVFLLGLFGIVSALVAVEAFNEYFDAQTGNDFVFAAEERGPLPPRVFWLGVAALTVAAAVGLVLSWQRGGWVLAFFAGGAVGVVFYVGPPLRLAYRGLGEAVIATCYGPLMILGAFYIQARRVTGRALLVSAPVALLIFALVVANEMPDYYQDMLVGKKNLVVRLGRRNAARVYGGALALFYVSLGVAILFRAFPVACVVLFGTLPLAWRMHARAARCPESPRELVPVIRNTVLLFSGALVTMGLGYLLFS